MKVVAFNGSARKDGNTARLVGYVFEELEKEGIDTEQVSLAGSRLAGCTACFQCGKNKDRRCVIDSDMLNDCLAKMIEAEGVILASPTYFCNVSAEMKALIDRAGFVARANDNLLRRKVGAAVVAVRRAGSLEVFNAMNHLFLISEMIIPGSCYWNMGYGLKPGDVDDDSEGVEIMRVLGRNMAWLLQRVHAG